MERIAPALAAGVDPALSALLETAGRAALAGGAVLKERYGKPHQVRHKGAIDLVTEADVAAEKAVVEVLRKEGGEGIAILAEESSAAYDGPPEGPAWIIDPLDGTTNFSHDFPFFAVSIAYADGVDTRVAVVYAPMQNELFCAILGGGAWLNGSPIRVSEVSVLKESLLATGFPYAIEQEVEPVLAVLRRFVTRSQGVRRAGAAALDLAWLACGRVDGFWEINLKPWDTAAAMLLVTEAGGRLTGYAGGTYHPYIPELAASNGRIHNEMLSLLGDFARY